MTVIHADLSSIILNSAQSFEEDWQTGKSLNGPALLIRRNKFSVGFAPAVTNKCDNFVCRPVYDFTSQYIVKVDDFFLHYLQKVMVYLFFITLLCLTLLNMPIYFDKLVFLLVTLLDFL